VGLEHQDDRRRLMRPLSRRRSRPPSPVADLVPVPEPRRWQKIAQAVLVLVMVSATIGVLGIVVRNSVLLGRMTTDVSIAQQRTTNLHNLQLSALHLSQTLSELDAAGDTDDVTVRRGLLGRMVTVVYSLYPASSPQAEELREVQSGLDRFPWDRLAGRPGRAGVLGAAKTLVSQIEVRVKAMYDNEEKFFYDATRDSLQAKRNSQNALVVLVSLVVVMAVCWLVLLRRRTRNRLVLAYSALLSEVSERRTLQDQLSHQAFHDALTGLPNRALFLRRLTETMESAGDSKDRPSVVLIDLDGFKTVNDTLGHAAGDDLLQQIAGRLRECVRAGNLVARLGGDEFAIVVPADAGQEGLTVGRRLIDALAAPITVAGQEISISASMGVARLDDQQAAADLLSDADIAMYAAKKAGKGRYELFRASMRDETQQRARLEQQLARAVANREIEVFYQPIVDLGTDRVTAVEALARWRHPQDGLVPPDVFIPIAEDSGLIREIGRDVLRQACATVQQWRRTVPGSEDLYVTVNVSARQLHSGTFSGHLFDALRDTGLPAANLTLEITESLLLEQSETVGAELARIRSLGVRLAMDDFGSGYSSVALLLRLQVDVLKIDKTFLDLDSREHGTLIRAVTELGHTLGLSVVAEGVETAGQLAHVRAAQCDAAQGYLLARPMPADDARRHLHGAQLVPAAGG
jgi:diguanylate cyclase (GGDEF)-like protein